MVSKKGGIELIMLAIMFLLAGIALLIYLNQEGFQPNEAIGQNEVRLLELKEEAVNKLIQADQAVKYSGYRTVNELIKNSLISESSCGYHVFPLLSGDCRYTDEEFKKEYLESYDFYTANTRNMPKYDFTINYGKQISIVAEPLENLRVYSNTQTFVLGTSAIFDTLPTDSGVLTSCYGERKLSSEAERYDFHDGIDFRATTGGSQAKVFAVEEGIVHSICVNSCNTLSDKNCKEVCGGFGTNIVITHPNGFLTRYSHLDSGSVKVSEGNRVVKGQEIAKAGNTGYSKTAHLDFKIYASVNDLGKRDAALSPFCYFSPIVSESLSFSAGADSCTEKYPEGLDLDNPSIYLLEECSYTVPNSEEIGEEIVLRAQRYNTIIAEAAADSNIPEALLKAIITQESAFEERAQSSTGPRGIMQFEKATAEEQGLIVNQEIDERIIPEKAIPAGANYLSRFYEKYNGNIIATAISYNAGDLITRNAISDCGPLTFENYEACIKDPLLDYYTKTKGKDFAQKKLKETTDYVPSVNGYYYWWGGPIGTSASFGSYYEVNPYTEAIIPFNLELFEEVQDYADLIIEECSGFETIEEVSDCIYYIIDDKTLTNDLSQCFYLDEKEDEKDKILRFIQEYENCKNYDWDDLNVTSCDCNIDYPEIPGVDITMLADRIQFIKDSAFSFKEGQVFYEHITEPQSLSPFVSFTYNNRRFLNDDEIVVQTLDGIGKFDHDGSAKLVRTEEGINLGNSNVICSAPPKALSFCYISDVEFPEMPFQEPRQVKIPFSVKLD